MLRLLGVLVVSRHQTRKVWWADPPLVYGVLLGVVAMLRWQQRAAPEPKPFSGQGP